MDSSYRVQVILQSKNLICLKKTLKQQHILALWSLAFLDVYTMTGTTDCRLYKGLPSFMADFFFLFLLVINFTWILPEWWIRRRKEKRSVWEEEFSLNCFCFKLLKCLCFVLAGVVQSDSDCDKPGRCARLCCQNCLWGKLECSFLSDMCLSCKLDYSGYLLMEVACPSSRKSPSQNLLHPVTRRCENWE